MYIAGCGFPLRNLCRGNGLIQSLRNILFAGGLVLPVLLSQPGKTPAAGGQWPMYGHDLAGTRYSPLTQINNRNVQRLTQVWSYHLQPAVEGGGAPEGGQAPTSEPTPIVVNGVMY